MQESTYESQTEMHHTDSSIADAVAAFKTGEPVLIHDFADREGETDIVYPAGDVAPEDVVRLRKDAGGLICVAVADGVADSFGLPFLEDEIDHPSASSHDLAYDSRSSFSLPVNHRETFTGITDVDRALTITELATSAQKAIIEPAEYTPDVFAKSFRSPGHVHLLRGAPNLLADRKGHTELGLALAAEADLPPAVVVCEMLDHTTGVATTPTDAKAYAAANDLVYVEGQALVEALTE